MCLCVSRHPAPHNRKRWGEARVYGLIWPQRSLLFWNRTAALQACFPYWSGIERFDPGTLAGKHDSLNALCEWIRTGLLEFHRPLQDVSWNRFDVIKWKFIDLDNRNWSGSLSCVSSSIGSKYEVSFPPNSTVNIFTDWKQKTSLLF